MTQKKIKTIEVDNLDICPSNFYVFNAMGKYIFFKTKDREAAQAAADEMYGKGFYRIRTTDLSAKTRTKRQLIEDMAEASKKEEQA